MFIRQFFRSHSVYYKYQASEKQNTNFRVIYQLININTSEFISCFINKFENTPRPQFPTTW